MGRLRISGFKGSNSSLAIYFSFLKKKSVPRGQVQHQSKYVKNYIYIHIYIFSIFHLVGSIFIHNSNILFDWNISSIQGFIFYFLFSFKWPIFILDLDEKLSSIQKL